MLTTNLHGLPPSIVRAIGEPHRPVPNRISITDFTNAPLMRILKEDHWNELEQDVSDMLWMLLGSSVHYILEKGAPLESLSEEKLEATYGNFQIVGVSDLWHDRKIIDYKVTSTWSIVLGDKTNYSIQLNLYEWLWRQHGYETDKLEVHAILRDWQKGRSLSGGDYPAALFVNIPIPMWEPGEATAIIDNWLIHYADRDMSPCTDEQRWMKPTTYAVMKEGRKSALRVLDSDYEAEAWIDMNNAKGVTIVERKGEYTRCKDYCMVSKVCEHNPYREAPHA